mmetsp:Transcript_63511/g.132167  ORF Transcript_63511/g.132167 Transcript_63511/m.132167 type:complete len:101 (-) Transcript_63511:1485-1787(-)
MSYHWIFHKHLRATRAQVQQGLRQVIHEEEEPIKVGYITTLNAESCLGQLKLKRGTIVAVCKNQAKNSRVLFSDGHDFDGIRVHLSKPPGSVPKCTCQQA